MSSIRIMILTLRAGAITILCHWVSHLILINSVLQYIFITSLVGRRYCGYIPDIQIALGFSSSIKQ